MDKSTPVSAPWYRSPILHSLLVIAVTKTLVHYQIIDKFTEGDIASFVDEFLNWAGYVAIAVAGASRLRSPLAPVTLTQKKADADNAAAVPESTAPPAPVVAEPQLPKEKS
jgi:hypothetical protein